MLCQSSAPRRPSPLYLQAIEWTVREPQGVFAPPGLDRRLRLVGRAAGRRSVLCSARAGRALPLGPHGEEGQDRAPCPSLPGRRAGAAAPGRQAPRVPGLGRPLPAPATPGSQRGRGTALQPAAAFPRRTQCGRGRQDIPVYYAKWEADERIGIGEFFMFQPDPGRAGPRQVGYALEGSGYREMGPDPRRDRCGARRWACRSVRKRRSCGCGTCEAGGALRGTSNWRRR